MSIDFITDQLAVGALEDAQSPESLRAAGIDLVLSLVPDVTVDAVRQVYLPVADREPLADDIIERALASMEGEIAAGGRVLLHCQMGISRSPALAVCYLRHAFGLSLSQALSAVRRARPSAMPHPALLASILDYFASDRPAPLRPPRPGPALEPLRG